MDARQRELASFCREGWWRHALMHDEWFESLSKSFPHAVEPISKEVKWFESRVRLWYQLLTCCAVMPTLRLALRPYATALFSGATFKPRATSSATEAQKAHLEANQRKIFEAALRIATAGKMPTVEAIAAEMGSTKETVSKFGTGEEILLGAVAQLMQNL